MIINIKKGSPIPTQAHEGEDAAYDIIAASEPRIQGSFLNQPLDGLKLYREIHYIEYSTGLFYSPEKEEIFKPNEFGLALFDNKKYHTHIFPRSSCCNYNLVLANSVATIDAGYTGELILRFKYIPQSKDLILWPENGIQRIFVQIDNERIYQKGNKIAQMVIFPTIHAKWNVVENLSTTQRSKGQFGSSGK